jgi:hypothetical protein
MEGRKLKERKKGKERKRQKRFSGIVDNFLIWTSYLTTE